MHHRLPLRRIFLNKEKEVAEKCDMCQHRTDVGLGPACVASCPSDALQFGDFDDPNDPVTKIDYTKAKAMPTICFGCTTHCGVVGWVQDGRVRRIDGNPLDPNSKGNICSKAQGMISFTYYPERLLYPLQRVGKRGEGKWKRVTWDEALTTIADKMRPLRENGVPEEFVL
ncbi:MAG: anaerobic selenocysteine-containing dehydrogenase [Verrucomicrobiales bacterium]